MYLQVASTSVFTRFSLLSISLKGHKIWPRKTKTVLSSVAVFLKNAVNYSESGWFLLFLHTSYKIFCAFHV